MREIRMLRSTWRELETGDYLTAPDLDPTCGVGATIGRPLYPTEPALDRIVPHPRTLRKARENVKAMVNSGVSPWRIRSYLHRWSTWWVGTAQSWQHQE